MKATYTPNRDDTNPAYLFSSTPTVLLVAAASGAISLKELAMNELANRGLDQQGNWVGFKQAETLLPERPSTHLYMGRLYHITGKEGKQFETGKLVWEYSHKEDGSDRRLWLDSAGMVYED